MSKTSYFSHDSNARNDSKIIKLRMRYGMEGYGTYFMILERLREETDYTSVADYNAIAYDLRVNTSLVKAVVEDFGLFSFTQDGKCFYSESFNARMGIKDKVRKARSEAGKRGNEKRWGAAANDSKPIANATEFYRKCDKELSQMRDEPIANATEIYRKESKVKESKVKENVEKKTPSVFRPPQLEEIKAYINEKGYKVDAEMWLNHYESNGWMVGKTKMRNWQAAVTTWQKRIEQEEKNRNRNGFYQPRNTPRRGEADFAATSAEEYSTTF